MDNFDAKQIVKIIYTNYRNEMSTRTIIPKKIYFTKTDWHPQEQWLIEAYDLDKKADRSFAIKDIKSWFVENE